MRWLVDECIAFDVVMALRSSGHDVLYAAETFRQVDDVDLAAEALRGGCILVTQDKGFGDLAFRKRRPMPGTVLLRIPRQQRALAPVRLLEVVARYGAALRDSFTVVDERRDRSRPLPRRE